ncbi:MAG: hypothetical protein PUA89_05855, partial [Frisingicoccus sp.]|nr:hypothetical protein [Frisingicoccus sp.]
DTMDMQKNIRVNREHKDSLFRFIFSDKKALLSLYNAVNDSDYTDKELLEIYTMEDEVLLRLTDQMEGTDAAEKSCTEFTAHMVNINEGHSPKMMERCPLLYEYSIFVGEIRKNTEAGMILVDAINTAVDECIKRGILADILRSNRAEVTDMLLKEYDEAFHIASEKEISFEEGRQMERMNTEKERQRAEAEKQRADEMDVKIKILTSRLRGETAEKIAENLGVDVEQVQKVLNNI